MRMDQINALTPSMEVRAHGESLHYTHTALVTRLEHTSAQENPCQRYHRHLLALQQRTIQSTPHLRSPLLPKSPGHTLSKCPQN